MKLLLDQNISRRIVSDLQAEYPGTEQVHALGLDTAADHEIWELARQQDFTIVSKDSDFEEMSLLFGSPPKVIWLRCGNQRSDYILELLTKNADSIKEFSRDDKAQCLEVF